MQYVLLASTMKLEWEADEAISNSIQLLKIFAVSRAGCTLAVGIALVSSFRQQAVGSPGVLPEGLQGRRPGLTVLTLFAPFQLGCWSSTLLTEKQRTSFCQCPLPK